MKNALYRLIVSWVVLILCNNCTAPPKEQQMLSDKKVEIACSRGWVLTVQQDGSGSLAYPAVHNCELWLRPGTVPFEDVRLLPAFRPQEQERYPFRWTYTATSAQERREYSLPDTLWGARWFELAYHHLMEQDGRTRTYRRLRKQWKEAPPVGISREG